MAKNKKRKKAKQRRSRGPILGIVLAVIVIGGLVAGGVVLGPRLVHHCSSCGKLFVGTGYYPNVISSTIGDLKGEETGILCRDDAILEHAVPISMGHTVDEYKIPLFE